MLTFGMSRPTCAKRFLDDLVVPSAGGGENRTLPGQVGKVNLSTTRPPGLHSCGDDQLVIEQNFDVDLTPP
jgi:hypothetical protein